MKAYMLGVLTASMLFALSAHAKGKVQYDVCAIDGGKLGVYEVSDKQAEALVLAKYLEKKHKRHYFVVVEAIDAKGDVK